MKKFLLALVLFGPATAFEIGGSALYWKTIAPSFHYAETFSNINAQGQGTQNTLHSVDPGFDWGLRIYASFCSATLDWTHYSVRDTNPTIITPVASPNPLSSPITFIFYPRAPDTPTGSNTARAIVERASATIKNEYDRVNLRWHHCLQSYCSMDLYAYAGVRWFRIRQSQKMEGSRSAIPVPLDQPAAFFSFSQSAEFNAGAIELGAGGIYCLGCNFDIVGHVGALAALGHRKLNGQTISTLEFTTARLLDRSNTHFASGIEVQLALRYTQECGCMKLTGELGYELNYYFNPIEIFQLSPTYDLNFHNIDVGYSGPYISLKLCF